MKTHSDVQLACFVALNVNHGSVKFHTEQILHLGSFPESGLCSAYIFTEMVKEERVAIIFN